MPPPESLRETSFANPLVLSAALYAGDGSTIFYERASLNEQAILSMFDLRQPRQPSGTKGVTLDVPEPGMAEHLDDQVGSRLPKMLVSPEHPRSESGTTGPVHRVGVEAAVEHFAVHGSFEQRLRQVEGVRQRQPQDAIGPENSPALLQYAAGVPEIEVLKCMRGVDARDGAVAKGKATRDAVAKDVCRPKSTCERRKAIRPSASTALPAVCARG